MNVYLNDTVIATSSNSLLSVLEEQELSNKRGVAVALNDEVIHKANWASTNLKENDSILVITATQGG